MTYSFAGGRRLQAILERERSLACTTGMGILGMCDSAARAWRNVEDSDPDLMSTLAVNSIRTTVSSMLTILMARTGARRWCETAAPEPSAAETFLRVFPGTRFICFHRSCADVVHAVLQSSPWGIIAGSFTPYLLQQPINSAAAIAAWWADYTGPLLAFEGRHPESCLRVRYEDLVNDTDATSAAIFEFIGVTPETMPAAPGPQAEEDDPTGASTPGAGAGFPAARLPPQLLERINTLNEQLGYPALSESP